MEIDKPVPFWFLDQESCAPCPCGEPFQYGETVVKIEGPAGLSTLYHYECFKDDEDG